MPTFDASTPAAFTVSSGTGTSASFTAPTGSRIAYKSVGFGAPSAPTTTPSGPTFTLIRLNSVEGAAYYLSTELTAPQAVSRTLSGSGSNAWVQPAVWTNVNSTTPTGALSDAAASSTTNNLSIGTVAGTGVTTAANSVLDGIDMDDNNLGAMGSSNTGFTQGSVPSDGIAGVACYSATIPSSGTAATLNFDAAGALAAAHRWVIVELIDAGGGGAAAPVAHDFVYPAAVRRAATR